jgi:hypothetical protein
MKSVAVALALAVKADCSLGHGFAATWTTS